MSRLVQFVVKYLPFLATEKLKANLQNLEEEVAARIEDVKTESKDIKSAAKNLAKETKDVVKAAKGTKGKSGRGRGRPRKNAN